MIDIILEFTFYFSKLKRISVSCSEVSRIPILADCCLVPPETYAEVCANTPDEVLALIEEAGTLFALRYGDSVLVPLPEKDVVLPDIEA